MGMLGTLAKVAIGIAVAKGVGSMMKRGQGGGGILGGGSQPSGQGGGLEEMMGDFLKGDRSGSRNSGGLQDIMGDLLGGGQGQSRNNQGGGLQDIMGDILSGGRQSGNKRGGGGLGDLLEQLGGGAQPRRGGSGGGLGDLIEGLAGNKSRGGGDLGDIFGEFLQDRQEPETNGGFGDIFNDALARGGEPETQPTRQQEVAAALMLKAMIQAAKSDGEIDEGEKTKLLNNLGDISNEERQFLNRELSEPVDVDALVNQVPHGLEEQIYLMSVMGIDLDNRKEAQYLHDLATGLEIDRDHVNSIHDHLGVPRLYK